MHSVSYEKRICADDAKVVNLLSSVRVGVLGLCDGSEPYAVPLYFVWLDGAVYFHGMGSGRKLALIAKNSSSCFTVYHDRGTVGDLMPCHADASYLCAMVFGSVERVEDHSLAARALNAFLEKYAPGMYRNGVSPETVERYRSSMDGRGVAVFRLVPSQITAKENDAAPDRSFATN